jgi:phospholipid transport system transporter-binding protein
MAAAITLPDRLTMADARAALAALEPAIAAEPAPTIDASALSTLDSAALAVLLECRRRALADGKPFEVHAPPPKLVELARLYGVDALLGLAGAPAAA